MSEQEIAWSATETQFMEPFAVSATALAECKLRFRDKDDFETTESRVVEGEDFWEDFAPEVLIHLDHEEFSTSTGLELDDAMISIAVRDRGLNKFQRIQGWHAPLIPKKPVDLLPAWVSFSHSDRLDLCVLATPISTVDRGDGVAQHHANVVARKVFKIRSLTKKSEFPLRWVSPEVFVGLGVSADTISLVNWLGEDLDRPPAETFEVLFNEDHREKLQLLNVGDDAAKAFRHELAASIFSEVAIHILRDGSEPREKIGTLNVIYDILLEVSGLEADQIRLRFDRLDGPSVVHAWSRSRFGVNDSLTQLEFVGGGA